MSYCFLSVSLCAYMHILSLSGHPPGPVWIRGINQRLERPVMSHHVCISLQLSWKTTVDDGKPCSQSSKPAAVTHNGSVIIVHIITSQPLNLPCRQVDWRPLTGLLYSGRLLSLMQRQREREFWGLPCEDTVPNVERIWIEIWRCETTVSDKFLLTWEKNLTSCRSGEVTDVTASRRYNSLCCSFT